ncbi:alkaline phosphatase family protein [Paenibacillus sp. GCM10027626]|uniref:alkaline phosphatase family protein n=1 Tax=Paenibacillus sp. GCM10027626 TaxID=3273411 RepID=UPI003642BAE7
MPTAAFQRVFILGMDGAGNFVQQAHTPHLDAWLARGAYTFSAQAELPTISAECWGSVLHGVRPGKHGLTNEKAENQPYPGDSPYPSLFRLMREQQPEAKLASFTGWQPINDGIIEDDPHIYKTSLPDARLVPALCKYVEQHPDVKLLFLQLDEPDASGHRYGYGADSPAYLDAITQCDNRIGTILAALEQQGLVEDSLIILLTDHGGGGADKYSHGSDHPMDRHVFWACIGSGIPRGELSQSLSITDTAAVAAYALGLSVPAEWDAQLPQQLFSKKELLS